MEKVEFTVSIEQEKLDALKYALTKKGGDTVQKELEKRVQEMYEELVPEELRGYVEYQIRPQPARSRPRKTAAKSNAADATEQLEDQGKGRQDNDKAGEQK